jgi:hypothetical protein
MCTFADNAYCVQAAQGDEDDVTAGNETANAEAAAAATAATAGAVEDMNGDTWESSDTDIPFLHLQLDIPNTPLFKDSQGGNIIPQVKQTSAAGFHVTLSRVSDAMMRFTSCPKHTVIDAWLWLTLALYCA